MSADDAPSATGDTLTRRVAPAAVLGVAFAFGVLVAVLALRDAGGGPATGISPRLDVTYATIEPVSAFFGQTLHAEAGILARGVPPQAIRVHPDFEPYAVVATDRTTDALQGGRTLVRVRWTLQCLRVACLAEHDGRQTYTFSVTASGAGTSGGRVRAFQPLVVLSRSAVTPSGLQTGFLLQRPPAGGPSGAETAAAGAVAVLLLGAAATLAARPLRRARPDVGLPMPETRLDRLRDALARVDAERDAIAWERRRGALDHLARTVGEDDAVLADEIRALAWREAEPDEDGVRRVLDRARRLVR